MTRSDWRVRPVRIELIVVPDCPDGDAAAELLRQALIDIGLAGVEFETTAVSTPEEAVRRGFGGSPSFIANDVDLFGAIPVGALACRVYPTDAGRAGVPALRDLRQALKRAADQQDG
jgi:hypothetical protein